MKSFHLLSKEQVDKVPLMEGGVMVLDEGVADCLRHFFATEKAKTVTIGGLHPDPSLHTPNFGDDFVYFTADAHCAELRVTAALPSTVVEGIRRDLLQVTLPRAGDFLVEAVTSPLNPRCALVHLQRKPGPSAAAATPAAPAPAYGEAPPLPPPPQEAEATAVAAPASEDATHPYKALIMGLEAKIDVLERANGETGRELSGSRAEIGRLRAELDHAIEAGAARGGAERQAEEMQRALATVAEQAKEAEVACEGWREAAADAERRLAELQADRDGLAERAAAAAVAGKKENGRLKQELAAQQDARPAVARLRKEAETLRGRAADASAGAESRVAEAEARLEAVQRDRDRLSNEAVILKDKLREKERKHAAERRRTQRLEKTQERVEELEAALREAKVAADGAPGTAAAAGGEKQGPSARSRSTSRRAGGGGGGAGAGAGAGSGAASSAAAGGDGKGVSAEVVTPLFANTTGERIQNELDHLGARFQGREEKLMGCLKLMYGSEEEFTVAIKAEDEVELQRQQEAERRRAEVEALAERVQQGNLALEKMKDKEQGMAQKFLEADREYAAELETLRRELLSARADATLSYTENTTLKHAAASAAAAATLAHDARVHANAAVAASAASAAAAGGAHPELPAALHAQQLPLHHHTAALAQHQPQHVATPVASYAAAALPGAYDAVSLSPDHMHTPAPNAAYGLRHVISPPPVV